MRIENTVEVDAPLDRVWALVNDIPRVAPCMPGAALTGVLDERTYEGTVAVKLGPLRMSYKGKVTVEDVDEPNHSARLAASGRDTKGAGTAKASVQTRMEAVGDTRTRLQVTSDVQLTGKVASFGRGGAINDVASRLFGQFADCLRTTLEAEPAASEGAAPPAPTPTAAPAAPVPSAPTPTESSAPTPTESSAPTPTGPEAPSRPVAAGDGTSTAAAGAPAPAAAAPDAQPTGGINQPAAGTGQPPATTPGAAPGTPLPTPPPRAVEALDAGSLVGTVVRGRLKALFQAIAGFFRRLFGRRPTG
jgi:uncharacterized protein